MCARLTDAWLPLFTLPAFLAVPVTAQQQVPPRELVHAHRHLHRADVALSPLPVQQAHVQRVRDGLKVVRARMEDCVDRHVQQALMPVNGMMDGWVRWSLVLLGGQSGGDAAADEDEDAAEIDAALRDMDSEDDDQAAALNTRQKASKNVV